MDPEPQIVRQDRKETSAPTQSGRGDGLPGRRQHCGRANLRIARHPFGPAQVNRFGVL